MSPEIHWQQIALRLSLTVLAGGLLGIERSKTGHAAVKPDAPARALRTSGSAA